MGTDPNNKILCFNFYFKEGKIGNVLTANDCRYKYLVFYSAPTSFPNSISNRYPLTFFFVYVRLKCFKYILLSIPVYIYISGKRHHHVHFTWYCTNVGMCTVLTHSWPRLNAVNKEKWKKECSTLCRLFIYEVVFLPEIVCLLIPWRQSLVISPISNGVQFWVQLNSVNMVCGWPCIVIQCG